MRSRVVRCQLIAGLVAADDVVTVEERAFLDSAMDAMGLTAEERETVLQTVDTTDASFAAATLLPGEKNALLEDLVVAAEADGFLHPAEEIYIQKVARAMGFDAQDIKAARSG